jgi:hypothetical protein
MSWKVVDLHDNGNCPQGSRPWSVCQTSDDEHSQRIHNGTTNEHSPSSNLVQDKPADHNENNGKHETANTNIEAVDGLQASYDEEIDVLGQECAAAHSNGRENEHHCQRTPEVQTVETVDVSPWLEFLISVFIADGLDEIGKPSVDRVVLAIKLDESL